MNYSLKQQSFCSRHLLWAAGSVQSGGMVLPTEMWLALPDAHPPEPLVWSTVDIVLADSLDRTSGGVYWYISINKIF